MKNIDWQVITYTSGANPYLCMTEAAFNRVRKKYGSKMRKYIRSAFNITYWIVDDREAD